jgi:hypothetical protein
MGLVEQQGPLRFDLKQLGLDRTACHEREGACMSEAERAVLEMKPMTGRMVGIWYIVRCCSNHGMVAVFRLLDLEGVYYIFFGKAMFLLGRLRGSCGVNRMRDGRGE